MQKESKNRKWLGIILRHIIFMACIVSLLPILPFPKIKAFFCAVSPFISINSIIATRTIIPVSFISIPLLIIMLFRKRWFCKYVCPTGLLLRYPSKIKHPYRRKITNIPKIGRWIIVLTFISSIIGYPMLLWLDPLALFSASVNVFYIDVINGLLFTGFIIPILFLLNLIWTDLWCSRLCPLDATHNLFASLSKLLRKKNTLGNQKQNIKLSRRSAFTFLSGALWSTFILKFHSKSYKQKVIRPPGACDESRFVATCVRCGNCINVCPTKIMYPDYGKYGLEGFLAPALNFDKKYCLNSCNKCSQVCPSGAISDFALEDKKNIKIGVAKVIHSECLLLAGLDCGICISACQYKALDTVMNDDLDYIIEVDKDKCCGCGACEAICPTAPRAITVKNIGNENP